MQEFTVTNLRMQADTFQHPTEVFESLPSNNGLFQGNKRLRFYSVALRSLNSVFLVVRRHKLSRESQRCRLFQQSPIPPLKQLFLVIVQTTMARKVFQHPQLSAAASSLMCMCGGGGVPDDIVSSSPPWTNKTHPFPQEKPACRLLAKRLCAPSVGELWNVTASA